MDAETNELFRDPFARNPELDDACLPNTVASLLAELLAGLRSPQGVSAFVAPSGSGKSMAAAALARRVGSVARAALLEVPTSSVAAIARQALAKLGDPDVDYDASVAPVEALRRNVERRTAGGRATVLVIDDAQRLSTQTLEDLTLLFEGPHALMLHVFLFGRPLLLDRIHAGAGQALRSHLLQVGRLEPLEATECLRYLERRIAMSGGKLHSIFGDAALEQVVRRAEGRLIRLEEVAAAAWDRAARRGAERVGVEDVRGVLPRSLDEEPLSMGTRQEPLQFDVDDMAGAPDEAWEAGDADADADDWGSAPQDHEDEDGDAWAAGHDDADSLALDDDGAEHEYAGSNARGQAGEEEDFGSFGEPGEEWDAREGSHRRAEPARRVASVGGGAARGRMFGRAALSMAACLALVWLANNVPGGSLEPDAGKGRDAKLFAEPVASQPTDILRLKDTAEEADADGQLLAWREFQVRALAEAEDRAEANAQVSVSTGHSEPLPRGERSRAEAAAPEASEQPSIAADSPKLVPAVQVTQGSAAWSEVEVSAGHPSGAGAATRKDTKAVQPVASTKATAKEAAAKSSIANATPSKPVSAAKPQPVMAKATQPKSVQPKSAPARTASARTAPVRPLPAAREASARVASTRGGTVYTVQLGAFRTRSNAEEMLGRLRNREARILLDGGLYRVMSGAFDNRAEAALHENSLKRAGYTTFVRAAEF